MTTDITTVVRTAVKIMSIKVNFQVDTKVAMEVDLVASALGFLGCSQSVSPVGSQTGMVVDKATDLLEVRMGHTARTTDDCGMKELTKSFSNRTSTE